MLSAGRLGRPPVIGFAPAPDEPELVAPPVGLVAGLVIPNRSVSVLPVLSFNKLPAIAPAPAPISVLVIGELVLGGDMVGF